MTLLISRDLKSSALISIYFTPDRTLVDGSEDEQN